MARQRKTRRTEPTADTALAYLEAALVAQEEAHRQAGFSIKNVVAGVTAAEVPGIALVAPYADNFVHGGLTVTRRKVDQLDNVYVYRTI